MLVLLETTALYALKIIGRRYGYNSIVSIESNDKVLMKGTVRELLDSNREILKYTRISSIVGENGEYFVSVAPKLM